MTPANELAEALSRLPADLGLKVSEDVGECHLSDATRRPGVLPAVVARPATATDLSALMTFCNTRRQPVVVQGGLTGLSGGARPQAGELAVSLERMRTVEAADATAMAIEAEAGAPLETVQARALEAGLVFGVDIGARGSATIGGMIATNAGGIRVLRNGMMRAQVAGLEVVLADGRIVSSMRGLAKDNSGPDLKQLFIGSEGTLGIVTRARLRLLPAPRHERNALCAVASLDAAFALLNHLRGRLGPELSAFEAIWPGVYAGVVAMRGGACPLPTGAGLYVLVETQSFREGEELFEMALAEALEQEFCHDVVMSRSSRDFDALWAIREACVEFTFSLGRLTGHDLSLPAATMSRFVSEAEAMARHIDPSVGIFIFGHLGDGNLHYIVRSDAIAEISPRIFALAASLGGAVTAEHGVGLDKTAYLSLVRSAEERSVMVEMKAALDPNGILNPGRIFRH